MFQELCVVGVFARVVFTGVFLGVIFTDTWYVLVRIRSQVWTYAPSSVYREHGTFIPFKNINTSSQRRTLTTTTSYYTIPCSTMCCCCCVDGKTTAILAKFKI